MSINWITAVRYKHQPQQAVLFFFGISDRAPAFWEASIALRGSFHEAKCLPRLQKHFYTLGSKQFGLVLKLRLSFQKSYRLEFFCFFQNGKPCSKLQEYPGVCF